MPSVGLSDELFGSLSSAELFWVGLTYRTCGPWVLPDPTAIFFVYDSSDTLNGPLGFKLAPQQQYMLFTNSLFSCVYRQVPATPFPSPTSSSFLVPSTSFSMLMSVEPSMFSPSIFPTDYVFPSVSPSSSSSFSFSFSSSISPTSSSSLSMSIPPSPSPSDSNSSTIQRRRGECFPASGSVQLEDGSVKTMDLLEVGDRVLVSPESVNDKRYSTVFLFTHREPSVWHDFIKICTSQNCLLLTSGHYIYVRQKCSNPSEVMIPAYMVQNGQCVQLGNSQWVHVNRVSNELSRGLYNPQTLQGDIVVDSIRATTYTTAMHPSTAHSIMFPLRFMFVLHRLSDIAYYKPSLWHRTEKLLTLFYSMKMFRFETV